MIDNAYAGTDPGFQTERFQIAPLAPPDARKLVEILLQDETLAGRVPWMEDKTRDGALREAYRIELQAAAGQLKVWSIVAREIRTQIGAIIASNSLGGIDVEVLVASQFWECDVVEEASEPVMQWLDDNADIIPDLPGLLQ